MKKIKINDIALINKANLNLKSKTIIRYLDTNNLTENKINQLQELKIGQDVIPSRARRKVEIGTIIYSKVRPNLKHYGIIDNKLSDIIVSTGFTTIDIININEFNPIYIYYNLIQNNNTALLHTIAANNASSYPSLTEDNIKNFELYVTTNINEQNKIVNTLSSLDKKTELNNKINEELEQMAKLLFDYWFVQFDFPNENGKPYKSSGGKMTYNPQLKREIPDGWEVKSLYDIATFTNGLALQNFRPKQDNAFLPVIKIKEMHNGFTKETEQADIAIPKEYQIQNGDILFSWSATLKVIIWAYGIGALNQHIFKVTSDQFPKSFIFYNLLNYIEYFKGIADKRKTTMGHITLDHLRTSYLPIPPAQLISKLDIKLSPIIDLIVKNKAENQQLTELRDWLLPMLMNGQVKIEE